MEEGLLHALPNRGVSISRLPTREARRIYLRTRRDLETLALRDGFPHWSGNDLLAVEKILRHFRVAAEFGDLSEVIEYDVAFHRSIIERYWEDNLLVLWLPLMTTLALPYSRHRDLMESYQEHLDILATLKKGDLEQALTLLKTHIQ